MRIHSGGFLQSWRDLKTKTKLLVSIVFGWQECVLGPHSVGFLQSFFGLTLINVSYCCKHWQFIAVGALALPNETQTTGSRSDGIKCLILKAQE